MKNNVYYELRELTERILYIRDFVLNYTPHDSEEYKKVTETYNALCRRRDLLEEKYGLK